MATSPLKQAGSFEKFRVDTDISSRPPSDPFIYIDPLSDETVRFYNYGVSLPAEDVVAVLSRAAREVAAHGSSQELIPDTIKRWGSGKVSLLLHHKNKMTWKIWKIALIGITDFVGRYEAVDMDFDVGQGGAKAIYGTGVLSLDLRDE